MTDTNQLSDRYSPAEVEERLYKWWEDSKFFRAEDISTKPPYSIILPPPNVTGSLHLGHALNHTLQDCLIRWKRMSGFNALWLPGTDHAGIATQSVVEKMLAGEKVTRKDLGREKFVEKVWEWKHKYGARIMEQARRMGNSVDWDRHVFTLDENVSKAVRKVFHDLYKKGSLYKGKRLINWSPKLESALSDLEVEYQEVKGNLYHIKYPVEGDDIELVIATTRPETMLADTAIAVHPEDERYKHLIGKTVILPLVGRKIPIIGDEHVEKDFGSGALKVTPAHDFNDYEIGQRHSLEMINILNLDGTMNSEAGVYSGLRVDKAREKVVKDLEEQGYLVKVEPHVHQVGHCSRSHCVVEPMLSNQWFVKMDDLVVPAKRAVENGTTSFEPASWTKTYLHWMNNIQDWCVSRQLWWGHRIPAWYCDDCEHITVSESDPTECEACQSKNIKQDEDVLDTWFSSALWPFSTLGWPDDTEALKTFYPTNVLVTAHDIIFFWVARMMVQGLEFKGDVPFRKVIIHGLIRDNQGRKMSKSLNNSVDPMEIIEEFGADALRFTLLSQVAAGRDLKFSMQRLEGYRNFMNKLWNAARFSLAALEDFEAPSEGVQALPNRSDLSDSDQWIIFKLGQAEEEIEKALSTHRFSDAAKVAYNFAWHEFCDWYLEFSKPVVYGEKSAERTATQLVLAQTLNRMMKLLHPFIPFITEEIFQKLPIKSETLVFETFPTVKTDKHWLKLGSEKVAEEMDLVRDVITAIRNIRGENRLNPGLEISARLAPSDDYGQKVLSGNKNIISKLARLSQCDVGDAGSLSKCAVSPVRQGDTHVDVIVPLEGLVDIDEEINRINKNMEKLRKEALGLNKRLSNKNFVDNAPEDIVEKGRAQLNDLNARIRSLEESLERLQ